MKYSTIEEYVSTLTEKEQILYREIIEEFQEKENNLKITRMETEKKMKELALSCRELEKGLEDLANPNTDAIAKILRSKGKPTLRLVKS